MNTITMRRVSERGYTTRFLSWLVNLPLRLASGLIALAYHTLAYVLPSRKTAGRIVFFQLFILGWVMAALFAHQTYNVRCAYNYQVHGWFTTKQECDDQYQAWMSQTTMTVN